MVQAELPPLSILIVDDDEDTQALIARQLKAADGWTLTIGQASDQESALASLKETPYDLVFLDYKLPGADGLEVLGKIRQLHEKSAVVMYTGAGNETVAVAAMKQGAMDYLTLEELRKSDVRRLFRRLLEVRKLENQNMELRQINQMKNEFIANVSHELRTPLSVVLGYARTMQSGTLGPVSDNQKKALEAIIDRADSLLTTLNQILKFRESTEKALQLTLKPLDLRAWLEARAAKPPKGLAKKKMRIDLALPQGPVWVRANEEKLSEALDNLLSNAVKFGPEGSAVSLSLDSAEGQARVRVSDQGPGIAPELLPHLFERLFAAIQGPTREYPGLGLGLALTHQIVESHSGRVWLESKGAGQGSAANIALPIAEKDSPEVAVGAGAPSKVEKKRILVVEDNPDLVEVLRLFMSSISPNLEISTTNSGFTALESIKEKIPHLLILDVMMPGMSGLEVIERLRKTPETAKIAVLVLTGYAEGAQMAMKIGAKDVLMKPFEKNSFVKKVIRLLGEPQAAANGR